MCGCAETTKRFSLCELIREHADKSDTEVNERNLNESGDTVTCRKKYIYSIFVPAELPQLKFSKYFNN